jgi:hypothetical protein
VWIVWGASTGFLGEIIMVEGITTVVAVMGWRGRGDGACCIAEELVLGCFLRVGGVLNARGRGGGV